MKQTALHVYWNPILECPNAILDGDSILDAGVHQSAYPESNIRYSSASVSLSGIQY